MKIRGFAAVFAVPILAALMVAATPAFGRSDVGVNLNINLGPPVIAAPPSEVVLMPGSNIYFVPGASVDLFFYNGYWWSPRGPRWYRAHEPNGPWVVVRSRYVPSPLIRVPRDYRVVYRGSDRIPYGHWKRMHDGHGRWDRHGEGRGHDRW